MEDEKYKYSYKGVDEYSSSFALNAVPEKSMSCICPIGKAPEKPTSIIEKADILDRYIKDNNIDLDKIKNNDLYTLKKASDLNPLLAAYSVFTNIEKRIVCIKDIVGYDYKNNGFGINDFISNMKAFYSDNNDEYMSRCNDLLKYNSDELLSVLSPSFKSEPISVKEVDDKFVINYNGLHRYNLLKLHYLNDISNSNDIDSVNQKYTFPVEVYNVDKDLSYCRALYSFNYPDSDCYINYNDEKNIEVTIDGKKDTMTREDLYSFISNNCINENTKKVIDKYNYLESFNKFVNKCSSFSNNKSL